MVKKGKIQKKGFFEVQSAATGTKISLYAASPAELDGKIVRLDLTRSLRGKSLELKLRVRNNDGKLMGETVSLELAGSYVRRMMRKGSDYVEDSFVAECKDSKVLIKPFMITRHKVSRSIRKMLRNSARDYLLSYLKNRSVKEVSTEITTNKLQKDLSLRLKKIYPLVLCEIRVLVILGDKSVTNLTQISEADSVEEKKEDKKLKNEKNRDNESKE